MCGLIGWFSREGSIRLPVLETMSNMISHRGPDGEGFFINPNKSVGFAHRRLAIIDTVAASDQPMFDVSRRYSIVFNGEIYNYIELRSELESLGFNFRTKSDTEVLLNVMIHWGEKGLPKLNGMFAFIFFDHERSMGIIARDRFGEKPLYYFCDGANLILASEMKAILTSKITDVAPNEMRMRELIAGSYLEDSDDTFFDKIFRFPQASFCTFKLTNLSVNPRRYWEPDYDFVDRSISFNEATEKFDSLFKRSVSLRLRADVPVGTSLSGGLDSSLVVGTLAGLKHTGSFNQKSFSAHFPKDPTLSEGDYIDMMVRSTGVQAYYTEPMAADLIKESEKLHWHQEEPFLSASIFLQWKVMELAKANRTTVLLDGQGADELLAGYSHYLIPYHVDLLNKGHYSKFIAESTWPRLRLKLAALGYKDASRRFSSNVGLTPLHLIKANRYGAPSSKYKTGLPELRPGNMLRKTLAEALQYNCLPALLRYADRNSMAHSREVRLPFLDYDLVDFCISLPEEFLIKRGWQKYIQRKAAKVLPKAIRWRAEKVGYAAPLDLWLRRDLKEWSYDKIFDGLGSQLEFFDRKTVSKLWADHQQGANNSWALWRWISISEWLDQVKRGRFSMAEKTTSRQAYEKNLNASQQPT